jgi:hypothetical protein
MVQESDFMELNHKLTHLLKGRTIIFDRSAFHRERFDLLKGSRLLPLVQERKIVVFHRPRHSSQRQTLPTLGHPEAKFEARKRDPKKFPHFTAFGGFLIYSLYDAEKNRNAPLDGNWQPSDERMLTPEQFVDELSRIQG